MPTIFGCLATKARKLAVEIAGADLDNETSARNSRISRPRHGTRADRIHAIGFVQPA